MTDMSSEGDVDVQFKYSRGEVLVPGAAALPPRVWRELLSQTSWPSSANSGQWVALPHPEKYDYWI